MADFVEALHGALSAAYGVAGPKRPVTHGQGRQTRMRRIMKALGGSRKAAAQAAGIPYSTWNHLYAGKRGVSAKNLDKLDRAFERIVTAPAIAAKIAAKGYPKVWKITAVVVADPGDKRYLNRKRDGPANEEGWREFNAEGLDSRAIVSAWQFSGPDVAARELQSEIKRVYGEPFGFEGEHCGVALVWRRPDDLRRRSDLRL